jgi:HD-GYP domain-containing protein (c-di-GMP phosphodiesterase class II)
MTSLEVSVNGEQGLVKTFQKLVANADEFEAYRNPHARRIAAIADEIAKTFNLAPGDRFSLRIAAFAHDLGEVVMNRTYIQLARPLSEEERLDLARHPLFGELEAARAGANRGAQLLVRWHHEWWNGSGYPDGLRFEQIPLGARILRVADTYAALTDARPFREAYSERQGREHLIQWAGLEFDPGVVHKFLALEPIKELKSYAPAREPAREIASPVTDEMLSRVQTLAADL